MDILRTDGPLPSEHKTRLAQGFFVVCIILSLFLLVHTWNAWKEGRFIGTGIGAQNTISVSGTGEVFAVPDVAEFSVGVTKEAATVVAAQEAMTDVMNDAIDYLKEQGVAEKDIRTSWFSVNPRYEYRESRVVCITYPCPQPPGERVLMGFTVSQQISAKVRKLDDAGKILGGLAEIGVTDVSGPTFTIDDPDELERAARKQAIDDAKAQAEELAHDLNVSLVRIVSFSEGGHAPIYMRAFESKALGGDALGAAPAPDIPVGENQITSSVTITYEIR